MIYGSLILKSVHGKRTRGKGHHLPQKKFQFNIKKSFYHRCGESNTRVAWKICAIWEIFSAQVGKILSNLMQFGSWHPRSKPSDINCFIIFWFCILRCGWLLWCSDKSSKSLLKVWVTHSRQCHLGNSGLQFLLCLSSSLAPHTKLCAVVLPKYLGGRN